MRKFILLASFLEASVSTFIDNPFELIYIYQNKKENENKDSKVDDYKEIIADFSNINEPIVRLSPKIETFDLKITFLSNKHQKNPRKKWKVEYKTNNKWLKGWNYNWNWYHKGCEIGKMLRDFIKEDQTIHFKNLLVLENYGYNIAQPDAMLILLFMFVFKVSFKEIYFKYLDPSWAVRWNCPEDFELPKSYDWYLNENNKFMFFEKYIVRNKNYQLFIGDVLSEQAVFNFKNINFDFYKNDIKFL